MADRSGAQGGRGGGGGGGERAWLPFRQFGRRGVVIRPRAGVVFRDGEWPHGLDSGTRVAEETPAAILPAHGPFVFEPVRLRHRPPDSLFPDAAVQPSTRKDSP